MPLGDVLSYKFEAFDELCKVATLPFGIWPGIRQHILPINEIDHRTALPTAAEHWSLDSIQLRSDAVLLRTETMKLQAAITAEGQNSQLVWNHHYTHPWDCFWKESSQPNIVCFLFQLTLCVFVLCDFQDSSKEGIFRIPGNSERQRRLKAKLNSAQLIDLNNEEFTTHDVACVLKTYLGDLPEPVLTEKHYLAHVQAAGN